MIKSGAVYAPLFIKLSFTVESFYRFACVFSQAFNDGTLLDFLQGLQIGFQRKTAQQLHQHFLAECRYNDSTPLPLFPPKHKQRLSPTAKTRNTHYYFHKIFHSTICQTSGRPKRSYSSALAIITETRSPGFNATPFFSI